VALVDTTPGDQQGSVLASSLLPSPGPKPVAFKLAYDRSAATGGSYRVVAALIDGDLAWLNNQGVAVPVPQPVIEDVAVPLTFMPDLLKANVTGTIVGSGLNGSGSPTSYATVMVIEHDSGRIIGFGASTPIGAAPVPFVVPYSLADIDHGAVYTAEATAWDGTVHWSSTGPTPVITSGAPTAGVAVNVTAGLAPTPPPTTAPSPSPAPIAPVDTGIGLGGWILLVALVIAAAALIAWAWVMYRRRTPKPKP
jgi:uncharacterized lipoprotein YbaY